MGGTGSVKKVLAVPVRRRSEDLPALREALAAALEGTGPAILPVPDGTAAGQTAVKLHVGAGVAPDIAVVMPTSGSTGTPKGVELSAAALTASAAATTERLGGPGQWTLTLPPTTIAGLQVMVRSWLAGTTPVVADEAASTVTGFTDATHRLTGGRCYTALVPTQLVRLLESPAGVQALQCYDAVLLGGGPVRPRLLHQAEAAGIPVVTTYGMTETSGGCVYDGIALPGVEVRIDADGRIALRGPMLFSGYLGEPDLTAEVLRDGEFLTADLGRYLNGRLSVLGRVDDVVVSGGVNVSLDAVSATLSEVPGIVESVVVGVPDPEWGTRVVAVVRAQQSEAALLPIVRAAVAARMGVPAAPRAVIAVEDFPRLASGKVDRLALRALAAGAGEEGAG